MPLLMCPRCDVVLEHLNSAEICARCGGVFLSSAVTDTVSRVLDPQNQQTGLDASRGVQAVVKTTPAVACPACRVMMRRYKFGPYLEVDSCHEHGSWYDKGELVRLKSALESGGVATEVKVAPPTTPATMATGSGLELAERVRNKPASARPPQGGIDPMVQEKINELARHEQWKEQQSRRRYHRGLGGNSWSDGDYDAIDLVADVLSFLR